MGFPHGYLVMFGDFDFRPHIIGYSNPTASSRLSVGQLFSVSGGVQHFGSKPNPKPAATLTLTLGLNSQDQSPREFEQVLHDWLVTVNAGEQRLWYAPRGTFDSTQWLYTYAKVIDNTDERQLRQGFSAQRQITFSIAEPFWYARRTHTDFYLDGERDFDGSWSYASYDEFTLSVGNSMSLYHAGSADALPVLVVDNNSGTIGDFVMNRIDADSRVLQGFSYAGTVNTTSNKQLIVNARNYTSTDLSNVTAHVGQQTFMSLKPGDNTLTITSATTLTGSPKLYVYYENTYHA